MKNTKSTQNENAVTNAARCCRYKSKVGLEMKPENRIQSPRDGEKEVSAVMETGVYIHSSVARLLPSNGGIQEARNTFR